MSLKLRGRIWHYEFEFNKKTYRKSTKQKNRDDAAAVEEAAQRRVRRRAAGLDEPLSLDETPSFTAWAEHCRRAKAKKLRRLDVWERTIRVVLAFWGKRPIRREPVAGGVYKDLRLADPISNPDLITEFEDWMTARGISGSTQNSYWSALSGLYRIALRPRNRKATGVTMNPFLDVDRSRTKRRRVNLPPENLRAWVQCAAPHARLALVVGALASKLRLDQVLELDFDQHFDRDLTFITFDEYKGLDAHQREPQVTPVGDDLRDVLLELKRARPGSSRVITWRGKGVKSIRRSCETAAIAAGLKWGIKDGVTFHALRKAFASEAAVLGLHEALVSIALDHKDPRTTRQHYTHVEALRQKPVFDRVATHFGLKETALEAVRALVRTDTRKELKSLGKRRSSKRSAA